MISASRIVLGLIFVTFGLNGFYPLIAVPEFHPFMAILVTSGYVYVIKMVEVAGGTLLLLNRFVPLALILLGPDIANILVYHALLDPRNWPIAVVNLALFLMLVLGYREYFASVLVKNAVSATSGARLAQGSRFSARRVSLSASSNAPADAENTE
jgi:putative oxidoreductase